MKLIKKTKCLLVIAASILFISCGEKYDYPWGNSTTKHFDFLAQETIIEVDPSVKSFRLEGMFSDDTDPKYLASPYVQYSLSTATTAEHKVHFINNITHEFKKGEGRNIYQDIVLIPENITSEVQIVYEVYANIDYNDPNKSQKHIHTTTIRLVPKVEE